MSVSLKKHPTEARVYIHEDTGSLIVVYDKYVAVWDSEDDWLSGDSAAWDMPTLRAVRENLAKREAGTFTPEISVGDIVDVEANPASPTGEGGWSGAVVYDIYTDAAGNRIASVSQPGFVGARQIRFYRLRKTS